MAVFPPVAGTRAPMPTPRGVKLMGDVPIGISWHSCDVFFHRDEFHLDWCGGSPPEGMSQSDPFFQQWGQNWGIPLYRWDHMEANGFRWWKTRIARLTEIFRMFRLDHILGFYRIYAFPWRPERNHEFLGLSHEQAADITGGRLPRWFLRPDDTVENKAANRADGDVRLRAILEAADGAEVIAEDLGWVPEYVRPHLDRSRHRRLPHSALGLQRIRPPDARQLFPGKLLRHLFHPRSRSGQRHLARLPATSSSSIRKTRPSNPAGRSTARTTRCASSPNSPASRSRPTARGRPSPRASACASSRPCSPRTPATPLLMITELFGLDDRINHPGTTRRQQLALPPAVDAPTRSRPIPPAGNLPQIRRRHQHHAAGK